MQVVFIGGPRHREEQTVIFDGTMELGDYSRTAAAGKRTHGGDWATAMAYFVYRGMDPDLAQASILKHLRDEPEPAPPQRVE